MTGEKKKAQEEAKRRMERIQAALTHLGSGDDMKEVRDKLNQEMSRAKQASEPQHLANDIEGKASAVTLASFACDTWTVCDLCASCFFGSRRNSSAWRLHAFLLSPKDKLLPSSVMMAMRA